MCVCVFRQKDVRWECHQWSEHWCGFILSSWCDLSPTLLGCRPHPLWMFIIQSKHLYISVQMYINAAFLFRKQLLSLTYFFSFKDNDQKNLLKALQLHNCSKGQTNRSRTECVIPFLSTRCPAAPLHKAARFTAPIFQGFPRSEEWPGCACHLVITSLNCCFNSPSCIAVTTYFCCLTLLSGSAAPLIKT